MLSKTTVAKLDAVEAYIERYLYLYNRGLTSYCEYWMNASINLFGYIYRKIEKKDDSLKQRVKYLIKKQKQSYSAIDKTVLTKETRKRFGLFVASPHLYFFLRNMYAKQKNKENN